MADAREFKVRHDVSVTIFIMACFCIGAVCGSFNRWLDRAYPDPPTAGAHK